MPHAENRSAPLRFIMFTTAGFLLLIVVLVFFIIFQFQLQAKTSAEDWVRSSSVMYRDRIEERFRNYVAGTDAVALNSSIRESLWRTDISEMYMVNLGDKLKRNIDSITYSFYNAQDIYSYNIYSYLPTVGGYFFNLDRAYTSVWYSKLIRSGLNSIAWYDYSKFTKSMHWNTAKVMQRQAWSTEGDGDGNCYQTMSINLNNLFSSETLFSGTTGVQIYAFDNVTGACVYGSSDRYVVDAEAYYREISQVEPSFEQQLHQTNVRRNSTILTLQRVPTMQMTVVMAFERTAHNLQMTVSDNIFLVILVVPFLLVLGFQIRFYRRFKRRLGHVTSHIDTFDSKSTTAIVPLGGTDEVSHIDRHLVQMLERIRTLITENYTQKMQNISSKLEALLVCINPHFLYNTLNTISATAYMEGADDTVKMVDSLSSMFRYSCDTSEKLVPLAMEVANIQEYLAIQMVRYQEQLDVSIDISPECTSVSIPKLTLQPVVENCFKHGFSAGVTGKTHRRITVTGGIVANCLRIAVEDNGNGMPPDVLEKLKNRLNISTDVDTDAEIGIHNVNSRIKLICGDTYGIDIESEHGKYTRVILRFPT